MTHQQLVDRHYAENNSNDLSRWPNTSLRTS
ncbi:hypothetical protein FHU33_2332 [Blastococcus colisei]|uniref:Uncharacterized protein n=1 Tax=Blastococcus colisei TaxID=1564162 RepID=A0A543PFR5_9ACTN|nr:hypothetical protein FHU33_2332 [Blastococcus colisei]